MADFGDRAQGVAPIIEITPHTYEPSTHDQQAAAEGVVASFDTVEFFGEKFRLADKVNMMPMIAFGNAAKSGADSNDMEGLAAMFRLIRSVIYRPYLTDEHGNRQRDPATGRPLRDESEWERFQQVADDEEADGDDVMAFVNQAMEAMSSRPTRRPGISSSSSGTTSERSKAASSSRDTDPRMQGMTPISEL